jgi:type II secretory pathway component PulM
MQQSVAVRGGMMAKMTSLAKETSPLDRVILAVAGSSMLLVIAMFGFWENHQTALMEHQQEMIDRLVDIQSMQSASMAALQEMVIANRRDLERD